MAKLFVIAGHGAGDPGAVGNGYQEAERVRVLAQRVKDLGGDSVMLGDFNRNYYADNGISSLNISKDYCILELHMDSASASAKGGHVIIKSGYDADKYDTALAKMISTIFPGRSQTIVGRSDLANPNRAAAKGYNYRLMECGFISNAGDVKTFNSRIDDIAKGILSSFDISVKASSNTSNNTNANSGTKVPYTVKVDVTALNIRKGPGTNYDKTGKYTGKGVFTIVEEADGPGASKWGLLKSYQNGRNGWISLDYAKKI